MKHTLESIAVLAGVSRGTVSRVINEQAGVKPAIREKVLSIIKETGYIPNPQARSLAGGKTGNIGVMVFGEKADFLTHHIFYEVLQGIQTDSAANAYDLLLFANRSDSDQEYWKRAGVTRKVDGLIIMGEHIQEQYLNYFRQQHIPFVLIGKRNFEQLPLVCVTSNYRSGAYQATKHLLERGRRQIVYIQGLQNVYHEDERFAGYRQALSEARVVLNESLVIAGQADKDEAYRQVNSLLDNNISFDAIFAANDLMAIGAMEALAERDYQIPQHISVVGYDDIQAASYLTPRLTTVRQDKIGLGQAAIRLLLDMFRGELAEDDAKDIIIESELMIRETT